MADKAIISDLGAGRIGGRSNLAPYIVPALIGLAPVATALISSMDPAHPIQPWERVMRAFALPVVAVELLVILLAFSGRGRWAPRGLGRGQLAAAAAMTVLMVGTAAFAATHPGAAFVRTSLWLVHLGFAWSVFRLCQRSIIEPTSLASALMGGFLVFCVILILFIARIEEPASFRWTHDLPGLDNFRRAAYFAAPVAGLCMGRFSAARRPDLVFPALIYTCAVALIVWTGARGAVLALGAAFLVGIALVPALRNLQVVLATLGGTAAGTAFAWLASLQTGFGGLWRVLPLAEQSALDPETDATSGRLDLWASTWQTILERPLFGHGEGQTAFAVPVGQQTVAFHPHNLVLQVLLAWGVVGALLLAYLAVPFARRFLANARQHGDLVPPFMAMLVLIIYSGVDGTLFHVHAVSIFAACAGMMWIRNTPAPALPGPPSSVAAINRRRGHPANSDAIIDQAF